MNKIRNALASSIVAIGVFASAQAEAQTTPLPYTLQSDPGIPLTSTKQQQDTVMRLVTAHLGLWLSPHPSAYRYEQLLTKDAVFEYPQSDRPELREIRGRDQVGAAVRELSREAVDWKFSDIKLIETPHPGVFFVAYRASAFVPSTQRPYEQLFVARVTVRDGKIENYYEMWDQKARAVAFGSPAQRKHS